MSQCTYVLCSICDQDIPLFLDVGATCSIISERLLLALGVVYNQSTVPKVIKHVGGSQITLLGKITLLVSFAPEVSIPVSFSALKDCAVPILLCLDVCQALKSEIDYENELFTFRFRSSLIELQLHSEDALREYQATIDHIDDDERVCLALSRLFLTSAGEPPSA